MSGSLADCLDALLLLCGFGLLARRRPAELLALYRVQSAVLAVAAFWQGALLGASGLFVAGLVILAGNAMLLPVLLRRLAWRADPAGAAPPVIPAVLAVAFGVGLLGLAALVLPPAGRGELTVALAVVLLGLLLMVSRRDAPGQAVGFLAMQNGLMLAAINTPGLPFVGVLAVALLALGVILPAALHLRATPDRRPPGPAAPLEFGR